MATVGSLKTSTRVIPPASRTPISMGRILCLLGISISPATMSSPMGRTCCQEAAACIIFTLPSSCSIRSSAMITASYGFRMGSPVSTTTKSSPGLKVIGSASDAPFVRSETTAMPSMAAALKSGEQYFAYTASAVTRFRLSSARISSRTGFTSPSRAFI